MAKSKDEKSGLSDDFHQVIDDIVELEFEDIPIPKTIKATYEERHRNDLNAKDYYANLLDLQKELIKLHNWVEQSGAKVLIICEGRDGAGKGGVIKRITQRLDPRVARVVALPKPSEKALNGIFNDTFPLPAGGEIVLLIDPGTTELGWNGSWVLQQKRKLRNFSEMLLN